MQPLPVALPVAAQTPYKYHVTNNHIHCSETFQLDSLREYFVFSCRDFIELFNDWIVWANTLHSVGHIETL